MSAASEIREALDAGEISQWVAVEQLCAVVDKQDATIAQLLDAVKLLAETCRDGFQLTDDRFRALGLYVRGQR